VAAVAQKGFDALANAPTDPPAEDVKVEQVAGLPQLQITPNREAIARYGANVEDVNDLVEAISAGKDAGLVYRGEQRFGLAVKFDESASRSEEAITNLVLDTPNGARVPAASRY
jgi:cobalt-zinc-cadmium resistance protein CzcA